MFKFASYKNSFLHILQVSAFCILLLLLFGFSRKLEPRDTQSSDSVTISSKTIPAWVEKKMTMDMNGSAKWIADNSQYKSKNEPFDAYGIEFNWGPGKKSLKSRLFAITNNQELGTIWEYFEFWHPGENKVLLYQWGSDGTIGCGELKQLDASAGKFELEQTFYDPVGSSWKTRHESEETQTEKRMKSSIYNNGAWKEDRTYVWRLSK